MTDNTFTKVSHSAKRLYGPPKLMLCGFPKEAQPKLATVLERVGLADLPMVWLTQEEFETPLAEILELPAGSGAGRSSTLPRALIVGGITEKQLQELMAACRRSGMQQALWATLTPTSVTWTLGYLLEHLMAEREAVLRQQQEK